MNMAMFVQHVCIFWCENCWVVCDFGSDCGIYVNGVWLSSGSDIWFLCGDMLCFGVLMEEF